MKLTEKKDLLVNAVSTMKSVEAIGQTGNMTEIPVPGQGDFDLFVLCGVIPDYEERQSCYAGQRQLYTECNMEVCRKMFTGDRRYSSGRRRGNHVYVFHSG